MNNPVSQSTSNAVMLGVRDVAKMLQCSDRHVTNMWKGGRLPAPVKLGQLVRWPRTMIEDWIQAGCPAGEKVA
jgi:excisionase family DNA binding protein